MCREPLHERTTIPRGVIGPDGIKRTLIIRLMVCDRCGSTHRELPGGLVVPYKRHCTENIQKMITGETKFIHWNASTAWRNRAWWDAITVYFLYIAASLKEKYDVTFTDPPVLREVVQVLANTNNWICTRSAITPG